MNDSTKQIEHRLREEAKRFLSASPIPELLRTLQARQQQRRLKRIASLAAGLLLAGMALAGYRFSRWEQIAGNSSQSPPQPAAGASPNSMVAGRESASASAHASTTDQLPPRIETVDYYSLSPTEQFAVRRFLEIENNSHSAQLWENSL